MDAAVHDSQAVDQMLMRGNTGSGVWADAAYRLSYPDCGSWGMREVRSTPTTICGGQWRRLDRKQLGLDGPFWSLINRRLHQGPEPLTDRRLRSNLPRGGYAWLSHA